MKSPGSERGEIVLEISRPMEGEVLPAIRGLMTTIAAQMGFSEEDIDQIEISVDEACANVIKHAYHGQESGSSGEPGIRLKARRYSDRLQIQVSDYGKGAKDGTHKGAADLNEYRRREKPGGLGTLIMTRFMDKVLVDYPEGKGTVVTLIKNLQGGQGESE